MSYDRKQTASLWWENQMVVVQYLEDLKKKILSFTHVVVRWVPWMDCFKDTVFEMIRKEGYSAYAFNCAECSDVSAESLLDRIVEKIGLHVNYNGTVESVLDELAKAKNLCLLWNLNDSQCDELNQLAGSLTEHGSPLCFVAVSSPEKLLQMKELNLTYSDTDLYFFIWDILMHRNSTNLIEYKAMLIQQLTHGDLMKIAVCCEAADNCMYSPNEVCKWLTEEQIRQDRYMAQLRFLTPLLETARYDMCQCFKGRLHGVKFPVSEKYGIGQKSVNNYTSADQFEFRHWDEYKNTGNLSDLTEDEKDWLKLLHQTRNDMAHLKPLLDKDKEIDVEQIKEIMDCCEKLHLASGQG